MNAAVDPDRLLSRLVDLSRISSSPPPAVTRLAWSPEWRAAVDALLAWATEAGVAAWVDPVGNVVAERPGTEPAYRPLATGSHLDTVPGGGPLDGAYGVVAAWEVLAALEEAGAELRHPVRAIAFVNEEGVVALPFTGSRAVAGLLSAGELAGSLQAALQGGGCQPAEWREAEWAEGAAAFVELHVEQGPVLDTAGAPIGVVTAVTGQQRGTIDVLGRANHAGTTPMAARHDALVAAADLVLAVRDLAGTRGCDVATVGRLEVEPGVGNVIPGRVAMSFDLRSTAAGRMDAAVEELRRRAEDIGGSRGVEVEVTPFAPTRPVPAHPAVHDAVERAAHGLGLETLAMPSGAGHDCAILGTCMPVGMIFVPSTGGVSHHGSESTPDHQLVDGARVLLRTLSDLDRVLA